MRPFVLAFCSRILLRQFWMTTVPVVLVRWQIVYMLLSLTKKHGPGCVSAASSSAPSLLYLSPGAPLTSYASQGERPYACDEPGCGKRFGQVKTNYILFQRARALTCCAFSLVLSRATSPSTKARTA